MCHDRIQLLVVTVAAVAAVAAKEEAEVVGSRPGLACTFAWRHASPRTLCPGRTYRCLPNSARLCTPRRISTTRRRSPHSSHTCHLPAYIVLRPHATQGNPCPARTYRCSPNSARLCTPRHISTTRRRSPHSWGAAVVSKVVAKAVEFSRWSRRHNPPAKYSPHVNRVRQCWCAPSCRMRLSQ